MVAGLPVLTTDVCGYAHFVQEAEAGLVVNSPYQQEDFDRQLLHMMTSSRLADWRGNGLAVAEHADIYSMPLRAADFICRSVSRDD